MKKLIDKLEKEKKLSKDEWIKLFKNRSKEDEEYLFKKSSNIRQQIYGKDVYIRGLIEFTNFCKNDCKYCGIRRSNSKASRYRLSKEEILDCCKEGYELGFRTFVMQGGEDAYFTDDILEDIIKEIKSSYSDCAVTLSIGERSYESYERLRKAGVDRYLLRHETANLEHYNKLHPKEMSMENRQKCLFNLKKIGFQVGAGIMVGSPYQTVECIAEDMLFLEKLKPEMIGIGPFISHRDTPFFNKENGNVDETIFIIALVRLMLPNALIPATTALGTLSPLGRERAISVGANVVMPNLSPKAVRKKYLLYDNKISTGEEAAESIEKLKNSIQKIGYKIVVSRGDFKNK